MAGSADRPERPDEGGAAVEAGATAEVPSGPSARRRWLELLFWILVLPIVAFAVGQGVHIKYQGDLISVVEESIGRPLTTEERASVTIDAYCADPQSEGDSVCTDLTIATSMEIISVVAVVVGLLLLGFIAYASRAARADRNVLLRLFRPGLRITLVGLVVLVVADGVLAAGTAYLALGVFMGRIAPFLLLAIAAGAAIAAFGIIRAVTRISQRATSSALGRRVDATTQPRLLAFVGELAGEVGTEPPDQIVAGLDPEFYVTEVDVETPNGTFGGRTMYLSLPLVRILSETELRAVLGHELGHFRGSDTRFSREFYPVYRGAGESINAIVAGGGGDGARSLALIPAFLLLDRFVGAFAAPERALSRDRELAADQAGAEAASPTAVGSALVKLAAFSPLWSGTIEAMMTATGEGDRIDNASSHFVGAIRAAAGPASLEHLDDRPIVHPTDSHPPLTDRLAALHLDPANVGTAALDVSPTSPGADLFDGLDELEIGLTRQAEGLIRAARVPAG